MIAIKLHIHAFAVAAMLAGTTLAADPTTHAAAPSARSSGFWEYSIQAALSVCHGHPDRASARPVSSSAKVNQTATPPVIAKAPLTPPTRLPVPLFPISTPRVPTTRPVAKDRPVLTRIEISLWPRLFSPKALVERPRAVEPPPLVASPDPQRPERPVLRAGARYAISTPPTSPLRIPTSPLRGMPGGPVPSISSAPLLTEDGSTNPPLIPPTTRPAELEDPDTVPPLPEDGALEKPIAPDQDAPVRPGGVPTAPPLPTTRPSDEH